MRAHCPVLWADDYRPARRDAIGNRWIGLLPPIDRIGSEADRAEAGVHSLPRPLPVRPPRRGDDWGEGARDDPRILLNPMASVPLTEAAPAAKSAALSVGTAD